MAYAKLEPSGCCIHKGKIQLRISMFLEPTDPYYEKHHVYAVDETSQGWLRGYKGKLDAESNPINQADYVAWVASLPHIWRDNPFHNHFIYVDTETSQAEILKQVRDAFDEFFNGWCQSKDMIEVWRSKVRPKFVARTLSAKQLQICETRLAQIKAMGIDYGY